MKILHITATHLNPTGGVPTVLKRLVAEQNRIENFSAKVISLNAEVDKMESPYFIKLNKKNTNNYVKQYLPDAVIFHSFYYMEYVDIAIQCLKLKIPFFVEPHGSFGKAAMTKSRFKKKLANNTVFRILIKNAFGFIFLNEGELSDSIYRTKHDLIIPNGIDMDNVNLCYENMLKKKRQIYFIGRFDINHKGLDYLLEAIQILDKRKELLLVEFYGQGDDDAVKYINDQLKQLKTVKAYNRGTVLGREKQQKLEQYGPMILTSRYEGFPMTVLEAWEMGNPCIVTPGTNVSKEIEDNSLGWVAELNAENIANVIIAAVEDYSNKKNEYIKKCKSYVKNNYSWENIADISYEKLCDCLK